MALTKGSSSGCSPGGSAQAPAVPRARATAGHSQGGQWQWEQSSAPAACRSPKELKIVRASWAPQVRSQARGAMLGRQPGVQLSLRAAGGKGKAGSKCLGTRLAQLSLGPAETCSEKKVDGKAFPVSPRDDSGDVLRAWQGIEGRRIQYIFKTWKC